MSGWIKFEKDLVNDPRVLRMAKELGLTWFFASASVCTDGIINARNADALPGVTLVLGALTRLWIYADSHCRDDNTLDLGAAEIDELLGIPDFCSTMPADWLVEIDENTVELPGFQEHNGVEAKKKALTQKRVARHRDSKKPNGVTHSNAIALPDQTRPDQTKTIQKEAPEIAVVFDHWRSVHGHEKAKLDTKRTKVIREALKLYPLDDLRRCISGYKLSAWHQGKNDRKQVYDDIELFLRDAKHIDNGIKFSTGTGGVQEWM